MTRTKQPQWFSHNDTRVPLAWQYRYNHAASINSDFRWFIIECARFGHWHAVENGLWDRFDQDDTMYTADWYMEQVATDLLWTGTWDEDDLEYMYWFMISKDLISEANELGKVKNLLKNKNKNKN